jgi:membrane-associated phospholipid phosphatase
MQLLKNFIATFSLLLAFSSHMSAQNFEQRILERLSEHRTPGMTHFMQRVSNTTSYISLAVPLGLFVAGAIERDADKKYKSVYILESIGVSTAIELSLKYLVRRPRPSTTDPLIIPATDIGSPSFPSGHSTEAFATATALSISYPKWYVIAPSFLWAGTVGFSRLYLGAHYPSDVLAGALVGAGSAFLAHVINQWLFHPVGRLAAVSL